LKKGKDIPIPQASCTNSFLNPLLLFLFHMHNTSSLLSGPFSQSAQTPTLLFSFLILPRAKPSNRPMATPLFLFFSLCESSPQRGRRAAWTICLHRRYRTRPCLCFVYRGHSGLHPGASHTRDWRIESKAEVLSPIITKWRSFSNPTENLWIKDQTRDRIGPESLCITAITFPYKYMPWRPPFDLKNPSRHLENPSSPRRLAASHRVIWSRSIVGPALRHFTPCLGQRTAG
jgi:hypothetical protein